MNVVSNTYLFYVPYPHCSQNTGVYPHALAAGMIIYLAPILISTDIRTRSSLFFASLIIEYTIPIGGMGVVFRI